MFLPFYYDDIALVLVPFVSVTTDFYDIVPVLVWLPLVDVLITSVVLLVVPALSELPDVSSPTLSLVAPSLLSSSKCRNLSS